MDSTIEARFSSALLIEGTDGLMDLVLQLKAENLKQVEIYDLFSQARLRLRNSGQGEDEDRVADAIDFIVGWCSPHMALFPSNLTNDEIENYKMSQQKEAQTRRD